MLEIEVLEVFFWLYLLHLVVSIENLLGLVKGVHYVERSLFALKLHMLHAKIDIFVELLTGKLSVCTDFNLLHLKGCSVILAREVRSTLVEGALS